MSARKYDFVHFRMNEEVTAECDEVVAFLSADPQSRRDIDRPVRADALRFALGLAIKHIRAGREPRSG